MYLGRIVAIGTTLKKKNVAIYRVSSRSFPNREARIKDTAASIMPRAGFEGDLSKNPYIAYNCLRLAGDYAVVSNGSHTDPIAEKIQLGMNARDAIALSLLTLDYEKDDYDTPRIAGVINNKDQIGWLGIIRKDALAVEAFKLKPGNVYYTSTYEKDTISKANIDTEFNVATPEKICEYALGKGVFAFFEKPVTAAVAVAYRKTFKLGVKSI